MPPTWPHSLQILHNNSLLTCFCASSRTNECCDRKFGCNLFEFQHLFIAKVARSGGRLSLGKAKLLHATMQRRRRRNDTSKLCRRASRLSLRRQFGWRTKYVVGPFKCQLADDLSPPCSVSWQSERESALNRPRNTLNRPRNPGFPGMSSDLMDLKMLLAAGRAHGE